jgi:hypothetical protein
METDSTLLLSPPPEGCSVELIYDGSTQSQGALAQLPHTLFDTMMEAHISRADAERLINQFNRVSFPIMRDDCFADIVKDIVTTAPSDRVETSLKEQLHTINSELDRQLKSVGDSVLAQVLSRALSDSQQSNIIDLIGLRSLHDAKSFVVHTLPGMVRALKEEESPETNTDRRGSMGNIHIAKCAQPNAGGVPREKPPSPPLSESLSSTPPSLRNLRKSQRIAARQPSKIPVKPQGVKKRRSGGRKKK